MPRFVTSFLAALATIAALGAASTAHAATVSSVHLYDDEIPDPVDPVELEVWRLAITAAPGEENRISVTTSAGAVVVRDTGAPILAGEGCAPAGDGAVSCPKPDGWLDIRAALGDGADTLDVDDGDPEPPGLPIRYYDMRDARIYAGPGSDTIVVGEGVAGYVAGGEGDDVLAGGGTMRGGPGADTLTGSGGDNTFHGGPGTDVLDAGTGDYAGDMLSYAGRPDGVVVDLAAATAGAPGEDDRIAGFEGVTGGAGPDVLSAGTAAATLRGAGGDDVLRGGPGDDSLEGGGGENRLSAGAGDDWIQGPRTPTRARDLRCGAGRDTLVHPSDRAVVSPACERLEPWKASSPEETLPMPPRLAGRRVSVRLGVTAGRCRVDATLFAGRRLVRTRSARCPRQGLGTRVLRWTLPRRPRPGTRLRLRLVKHDAAWGTERGGFTVRVP
jgi:hypothetical protein